MTQTIPVTLLILLALIRQRRRFTVANKEQITKHFDFATLLTIAQQRGHVYPQMLTQQIQHCCFDPGNNVNSGTQIEGLQTTPTGIAIGKCIAYGIQHIFIFAKRFADYQRDRIFQGFANFLAAGNFTDASMAGVIFDNHNITREEWGMRAAQIHQHAVVTRNRNNLHSGNDWGSKLCTHHCVLIQNQ